MEIATPPLFTEKDKQLCEKHGFKYNIVNQLVVPDHITPSSYHYSRTFPVTSQDVCVTTYPKCGTTWGIYIVYLLMQQGKVSEKASLWHAHLWPALNLPDDKQEEVLKAVPSPRILKSHMPYHMAVGGNPALSPCKHIYIARNPMDAVTSYFKFLKSLGFYAGTFDFFLRLFMEKKGRYGCWFDHVKGWQEHQKLDNVLFLWYEDLIQDFDTQVHKIANFLNYPLSKDLLHHIKEESSFQKMKTNPFTKMPGNFYRKGIIGSGKQQFNEEQKRRFEKWMNKRLRETGLDLRMKN